MSETSKMLQKEIRPNESVEREDARSINAKRQGESNGEVAMPKLPVVNEALLNHGSELHWRRIGSGDQRLDFRWKN